MHFLHSALTDVGKQRDNNEDALHVDATHGVAILADGMGGYNAGEVASAMAVDIVAAEMARYFSKARRPANVRDLRRAMEVCVDRANRSIFKAAHTEASYAGMGTTLVMAVLHGDALLIGHAGDSRAYRLRDDEFVQLTRDHSLLQEQIDAGLVSPEEAATAPIRNLVTRALGVEESVLLDVETFTAELGDLYLLCSDGLSDMVEGHEIADTIAGPTSLQRKAEQLIELANTRGGQDNTSVVLLQIIETPKKSGFIAKLRP